MELKFGCLVQVLVDRIGDDPVAVWHDSVIISDFGLSTILDTTPKVKVRAVEGLIAADDSHLKILGRPIRLADYLVAIINENAEHENFTEWYAKELPGIVAAWPLLKDDLNNVPESTVDYLYNILCL